MEKQMWIFKEKAILEVKKFSFEVNVFKHSIYGEVVEVNYGIGNEESVLWKIFNPNAASDADLKKATLYRKMTGTDVKEPKHIFLQFLSYNSDTGKFNVIVK